MKKKRNFLIFNLLIFFLLASAIDFTGCAGALEVQSAAQKTALKIDGFDEDWNISPTLLKDEQISYRISNDDKFLYLCLVAHSREKALQIFSLGLTVWIDRTGKEKEVFGIHYPIGLEGRGFPIRRSRLDDNIDRNRSEQLYNDLKESLKKIEIISPEKGNSGIIDVVRVKGIEVGIGNLDQSLIYELKVPLNKSPDYLYAIEPDTLFPLGIGFKTGKFNAAMLRNPADDTPSGGESSSGRRGGGRSGGSGSRPAQGARGPQMPKEIELWFRTILSK